MGLALVNKYLGSGSVADRSIGGRIGRFLGLTAGVPSSIAFSAGQAWNESKQVYAEAEKERAASKILSYGVAKIPVLHAAWANVKELVKKAEVTKKNLAMSGLPCNQYLTEIQALDLQVKQAEGACQRDAGISFGELDSSFGKFNSSDEFKATAKRCVGPLKTQLSTDRKALLEEGDRIAKAVATIDTLSASLDETGRVLGF